MAALKVRAFVVAASAASGPARRLKSSLRALLSAGASRAQPWLRVACVVLLALGFVLPPRHGLGQDAAPAGRSVVVTSAADAGPGTLRAALIPIVLR